MKKLLLLVAIFTTPAPAMDHTRFDKYSDMEGVATSLLTQEMLSMFIESEADHPEAPESDDTFASLTALKVFTTGDERVSAQMQVEVDNHVRSAGLEELMRMKDGGANIKTYINQDKDTNKVTEFLIFITGAKGINMDSGSNINGRNREPVTILLVLTGDIDLRQISKLSQKIDVPGGHYFGKLGGM